MRAGTGNGELKYTMTCHLELILTICELGMGVQLHLKFEIESSAKYVM